MDKNQDNPQLYYKLQDMKLIYESFEEYLIHTYLTAEQLLEALEETVGALRFHKGQCDCAGRVYRIYSGAVKASGKIIASFLGGICGADSGQ